MGIFKKSKEKLEREQLKRDIIGFSLLQARQDLQSVIDDLKTEESKSFFVNLLNGIDWVISEDYPNIDNNPISKPKWQELK